MNWAGFRRKWSWYCHGIWLEGLRKPWQMSVRVAVFLAEIQTEHYLYVSPKSVTATPTYSVIMITKNRISVLDFTTLQFLYMFLENENATSVYLFSKLLVLSCVWARRPVYGCGSEIFYVLMSGSYQIYLNISWKNQGIEQENNIVPSPFTPTLSLSY